MTVLHFLLQISFKVGFIKKSRLPLDRHMEMVVKFQLPFCDF